MAKHQCPDCGVSHEMSAEGRMDKLEKRVEELEIKQRMWSFTTQMLSDDSSFPVIKAK